MKQKLYEGKAEGILGNARPKIPSPEEFFLKGDLNLIFTVREPGRRNNQSGPAVCVSAKHGCG